MDKVLTGIIEQIATKYNLDTKEVELILNCPYKMMREIILKLELQGKTYDQINDLKTNFNMPLLFKMYLSEYKLNFYNEKKDDATEEDD